MASARLTDCPTREIVFAVVQNLFWAFCRWMQKKSADAAPASRVPKQSERPMPEPPLARMGEAEPRGFLCQGGARSRSRSRSRAFYWRRTVVSAAEALEAEGIAARAVRAAEARDRGHQANLRATCARAHAHDVTTLVITRSSSGGSTLADSYSQCSYFSIRQMHLGISRFKLCSKRSGHRSIRHSAFWRKRSDRVLWLRPSMSNSMRQTRVIYCGPGFPASVRLKRRRKWCCTTR